MSSVDEETGTIADLQVRPFGEVRKGYTYFGEGDVLFAKITPCMQNGKASIVRGLTDGIGFGSTEFHVLRPKDDVLSEWIFYFVRQERFREEAQRKFRGAVGQQRVPQEFLEEYSIPVPPTTDEQRRIVVKIEALFDRIREAKRLRAEGTKDLGQLMSAALADVFPDPRGKLPEGWEGKIVEEISEKPQYGYTQAARDEPVGPKFLRITDIQNGQVNWEAVPYCDCEAGALKKYKLQAGDLLFARSGATTGKTFLVTQCPEAVFASYLIRLRL
ncbi:MAG: restriction endonuclease subunit S, partial [Deltaproteobacteria bacterium]|nr:restriction endonuclease subunit S [Deltaproteobacteria bacterium]